MKPSQTKGFTIVELLVVIVVLVILAAITIVSYQSIQIKARAGVTASTFRDIKRAMISMRGANNEGTWPLESEYPDPYVQGTEYPPSIDYMIRKTEFGKYMKELPKTLGNNADWSYANNGSGPEDIGNCSGLYKGPLIIVKDRDFKGVGKIIDEQIDDGNPNCGTVRVDEKYGNIVYRLSSDQEL